MVRTGSNGAASGGGSGNKVKRTHEIYRNKRPRGRPPTTPGIDVGKTNKANTNEVTQHVMSRLMTEDPLGVTDLQRTLPGVPKDIIQGCIDVLQVMGIVIQIEDIQVHTSVVSLDLPPAVTPSSSTPKTSFSINGSNQTNKSNIVIPRQTTIQKYTLVGFTKASEYTDITTMSQLVEAKEKNIAFTKERIKKLQEISLLPDASVEARRSLLKEHLQQCVAQDQALKADALYSNLLELL